VNLIGLVLAGGVALTPPVDSDEITTAWVVQADASQVGEHSVRDGSYVVKHRLLPSSLVRLQEDVTDGKSGKVLIGAGEQLFGLLTSGSPVFCVNKMPKQNLARSLLFGSGNLMRCFVDSNDDGKIDGHFNAGNAVPGLPNFSRKRPKKPKLASGGRYERIDPALDDQQYFVGIRYEGRAAIIGRGAIPTFSVRFGTDGHEGSLSEDAIPDGATLPFDLRMLGARFSVLSRDGETIRVNVTEAMPEQRFGVVQTIRYN